jgi:hypothetical protein
MVTIINFLLLLLVLVLYIMRGHYGDVILNHFRSHVFSKYGRMRMPGKDIGHDS